MVVAALVLTQLTYRAIFSVSSFIKITVIAAFRTYFHFTLHDRVFGGDRGSPKLCSYKLELSVGFEPTLVRVRTPLTYPVGRREL